MSSAKHPVAGFNPNGTGIKGKLFGLPYSPENADLIIIGVPWEVTVTSGSGTVLGPKAILDVSNQIDLCLNNITDVWKMKVSMLPIPQELISANTQLRELALKHIHDLESGKKIENPSIITEKINEACENMNIYVRSVTERLMLQGKSVGLVGGDHSTPLGFLRALGDRHKNFGILQIDAHADLRKAYEGFIYSHASIMFNALKISSVSKLVQVGIRDYCQEELDLIAHSKGKVKTFLDQDIKEQQYKGRSWDNVVDAIINHLPEHVYISFDIDGLDPKLCPGTGTPVPGGLEFDQAIYLIRRLALSGKKIIGFDLCEVTSGQWDATVGARILFQLSAWMTVSEKKLAASK
jgi:agmatinase